MTDARDNAPIVFLHIPKTAGTTLSTILRHHYPGQRFEGGINAFKRFEQAERRLDAAARRGGRRALSAEVTFGLAARFLPDARYVTILREPVDRALSQLWYFRTGQGAGQLAPEKPLPTPNMTVDEAIDGGYILDNLQTRMLCGIVSPFDPLPSDALEQAKRTLAERVSYVGTAERFDEFLALLALELGWPTVPYDRKRVNKLSRGRDGISPRELKRVEESNRLDTELFEHAQHLLSQALSAAGSALEQEVEVLRRALPLQRRARLGKVPEVEAIRSLPIEVRVAFALKEAELGRARMLERRKMKRLGRQRPNQVERDADPRNGDQDEAAARARS
jgi:hypothetical protein